ncbi:uncharacterized protein LOC141580904 [Saimiri boliviensis]|uniref:uncharacterized protein LOC141580904 n=1 Tax=Saimiri boliviensis TaxID=27679 RepID=UPI003D779F82
MRFISSRSSRLWAQEAPGGMDGTGRAGPGSGSGRIIPEPIPRRWLGLCGESGRAAEPRAGSKPAAGTTGPRVGRPVAVGVHRPGESETKAHLWRALCKAPGSQERKDAQPGPVGPQGQRGAGGEPGGTGCHRSRSRGVARAFRAVSCPPGSSRPWSSDAGSGDFWGGKAGSRGVVATPGRRHGCAQKPVLASGGRARRPGREFLLPACAPSNGPCLGHNDCSPVRSPRPSPVSPECLFRALSPSAVTAQGLCDATVGLPSLPGTWERALGADLYSPQSRTQPRLGLSTRGETGCGAPAPSAWHLQTAFQLPQPAFQNAGNRRTGRLRGYSGFPARLRPLGRSFRGVSDRPARCCGNRKPAGCAQGSGCSAGSSRPQKPPGAGERAPAPPGAPHDWRCAQRGKAWLLYPAKTSMPSRCLGLCSFLMVNP